MFFTFLYVSELEAEKFQIKNLPGSLYLQFDYGGLINYLRLINGSYLSNYKIHKIHRVFESSQIFCSFYIQMVKSSRSFLLSSEYSGFSKSNNF